MFDNKVGMLNVVTTSALAEARYSVKTLWTCNLRTENQYNWREVSIMLERLVRLLQSLSQHFAKQVDFWLLQWVRK